MPELDFNESMALIREAKSLESTAQLDEASALYLRCLERCPATDRPYSADRLRIISQTLPEVSGAAWAVAAHIEARLVGPDDASSKTHLADLAALMGLYRAFGETERVDKLLARLRARSSEDRYRKALGYFSTFMPVSVRVSESDAEFLAQDVETAVAVDRDYVEAGALAEPLEELRVTTAAGYTVALATSGRPVAARRVLRAAIRGTSGEACTKIALAVSSWKSAAAERALCAECPGAESCTTSVDPGAPSE